MQVWQQVKAANPGFSICEIGATIGRMWRELSDEEKQRHMEDFTKDKVSRLFHFDMLYLLIEPIWNATAFCHENGACVFFSGSVV